MTSPRPLLPNTAMLLALALAACGSETSGDSSAFQPPAAAGAANGGGGVGGASSSAGASGQGLETLPDPGQAPDYTFGHMFFSRLQTSTDDRLRIDGKFMKPTTPLNVTNLQHMFSRYEALAMDTCGRLDKGFIVEGSGEVTAVDGGAIQVIGPDGNALPIAKKTMFGNVFYGAELAPELFLPLQEYQVQHAQWSGSFHTPGILTLTEPAPNTGTLDIPGASLKLRWTSTADGFPAYAFLIKGDKTVTCRMQDDGEFDVPASAIQEVAEEDPFNPTANNAIAQLRVIKYSWYFLGVDKGTARMTVIAESGAELTVDF